MKKFSPKRPLGECPTIEPSDEEKVLIHAKQARVTLAVRSHGNNSRAAKNSMSRVWRERKRMAFTPCGACAIHATCEKRKAKKLKGCNYAIISTPSGPKAACSVCFVEERTRFKKKGGAK